MSIVHLHVHSDQSAFDGLRPSRAFLERAKELGQEAIAFTEHGTVRGLWSAHEAGQEVGVRVIPGVEAYLVDDAERRGLSKEEREEIARRYVGAAEVKSALAAEESRRRDRDHVTVWAETEEGYRNLMRLMTWAWTKGFYGKPRVDLQRLKEYAAGLLVTTGCPTGLVSSPLRKGNPSLARERLRFLSETFGDRAYVEIMPHIVDGHTEVASSLLRLAERYGLRVVVTQDAHYPRETDADVQDTLLCVHTRSKKNEVDRFRFGTRDFWLRSREEMVEAFNRTLPDFPSAALARGLDETLAVADRCKAAFMPAPLGSYLAAPPLPDGVVDYAHWLVSLCETGLRTRALRAPRDLYEARLAFELERVLERALERYFVAVWDMRGWAREQGICCGPGRGSAAGSLVAYLLRITDVDPIRHDLSFDRFLPPGRKDLPDIDLDYDSARRQEVIEYLRGKYGDDCVAQISTSTLFGGKSILQDLRRVYEMAEDDIASVAACCERAKVEEEEGYELAEALETPEGEEFRRRFPVPAAVGVALEGQLRSVGVHPAGVVVSRVPLADIAPLESRGGKDRRVPVVAFDMVGVEKIGLVKLDILGLTALTVLDRLSRETGVKLDEIDYEDPAIYALLRKRRFAGVFQMDADSARRVSRGYPFRDFRSLEAFLAINRPGPLNSGQAALFVRRAAGRVPAPPVHPAYDAVTAETHGVLVYQEQLIGLAQELAGYTPERADEFRKRVAKKQGLSEEEASFVAGCVGSGMDEEQAGRLWAAIVEYAAYCFNKSHACSYAVLSAITAWFKVYHFARFVAAYMSVDEKVCFRLSAEAAECGVAIRPPSVNHSRALFEVVHNDSKAVRTGLLCLKGVGETAARALAESAPYASLADLLRATKTPRGVTQRTVEALAMAGALDDLVPHRRLLVENVRELWQAVRRGWSPQIVCPEIPDYTEEERRAVASKVLPPIADPAVIQRFRNTRSILKRLRLRLPEVDEVDLVPGSGQIVVGCVEDWKVFEGVSGGQQGRLSLASPTESLSVAVGGSRAARWPFALGDILLALLWCSSGGWTSLEAAWPAAALCEEVWPKGLRYAVFPPDTRPRDPAAALASLDAGKACYLTGGIVSRSRRVTRAGSDETSVVLAAPRGMVRLPAYGDAAMDPDVQDHLRVGTIARVRVRCVERGFVVIDRASSVQEF